MGLQLFGDGACLVVMALISSASSAQSAGPQVDTVRKSPTNVKAAQALALFDGMDFVGPEQIQELAVPVIAHRLVMEPQARFSGLTARGVVQDVLKKLKVPA